MRFSVILETATYTLFLFQASAGQWNLEQNIKHMKKHAFNSLIENKIRKVGLDELNEEKENRSKIKNLIYKELKTQKYLKMENPIISNGYCAT